MEADDTRSGVLISKVTSDRVHKRGPQRVIAPFQRLFYREDYLRWSHSLSRIITDVHRLDQHPAQGGAGRDAHHDRGQSLRIVPKQFFFADQRLADNVEAETLQPGTIGCDRN